MTADGALALRATMTFTAGTLAVPSPSSTYGSVRFTPPFGIGVGVSRSNVDGPDPMPWTLYKCAWHAWMGWRNVCIPECPGAFLDSLGSSIEGEGGSVDERCPNVAACFKLTFALDGLAGGLDNVHARGSGDFVSFGLGTPVVPLRDAFFPNINSALFFFGSATLASLAAAAIDCSAGPIVAGGVCRLLVVNIRRKLLSFSLEYIGILDVDVIGETSASAAVCSASASASAVAARGLENNLLFQDTCLRTRGAVDDRKSSGVSISSDSVVKTVTVRSTSAGQQTDSMSSK